VRIGGILEALDASLLVGGERLDAEVDLVYASDLMSDVLAFGKPSSLLLTGLTTQQAVIAAHMAEFKGVVFIRGKKAKDEIVKLAGENNLVLMTTKLDMYDACVRIEAARKGASPSVARPSTAPPGHEDLLLSHEFPIEGGNFANAGVVSTEVKSILKKIGLDPKLVRRVAISTFEGEMNVVMHARRGRVLLDVTPRSIDMVIEDEGPGIQDIELAMQEGFTTATEEMRAMGFGSGMGLPNIKRNADRMQIESTIGKGTALKLQFAV